MDGFKRSLRALLLQGLLSLYMLNHYRCSDRWADEAARSEYGERRSSGLLWSLRPWRERSVRMGYGMSRSIPGVRGGIRGKIVEVRAYLDGGLLDRAVVENGISVKQT